MFLVNSRTPFATETCPVRSRHPLYQRYGASLPSSLNAVILIRLGILSQGHLSRFSVRSHEIHLVSLFMDSRPQLDIATIPGFTLILIIIILLRLIPVKHHDNDALPSPKCRKTNYRCRVVFMWYRNMNLFPIPSLRFTGEVRTD